MHPLRVESLFPTDFCLSCGLQSQNVLGLIFLVQDPRSCVCLKSLSPWGETLIVIVIVTVIVIVLLITMSLPEKSFN